MSVLMIVPVCRSSFTRSGRAFPLSSSEGDFRMRETLKKWGFLHCVEK
jgi:hypothetical protein